MIGRPPRTHLDVAETKEEQQMGLEKLGFGEKLKKIKGRVCIDLIDWISSIGRDPLYL